MARNSDAADTFSWSGRTVEITLLDTNSTKVTGKVTGLEQGFLELVKETRGGNWAVDTLIPISSIAQIEAKSSGI